MMPTQKTLFHNMLRRPLILTGLACVGLISGLAPMSTFAQTESPEIVSDGIARIAQANLLPMLTQRVAAASCSLTSDVDVEESHDVLEEATAQFETIVLALRDGDPDLNIIAPEQRRPIIADIEHIWTEWALVHDAIAAVLADGHDVENAHVIDDHNLALFELANILVADITGQYSDPYVMNQSDVFVFGLMARQRTLTQQMAKDACEIWTGYHSQEAKDDLNTVMVVFERSLYALRDGLPEMGIQAAPTDEIQADLDDLISRWDVLKGNLLALVAGEEINMDAKYEIFHDFNIELERIGMLVKHYQDHSRRRY